MLPLANVLSTDGNRFVMAMNIGARMTMVVERNATATVNDMNNMHICFIGVGLNSLRGTSALALLPLLVEVEDAMV